MVRLLYINNSRLPTEKAHGLQIVQNCEAFADAGADVRLWAARRLNTPELRGVRDIWAHYGVKPNFTLRRIPCLDLLLFAPAANGLFAKVAFGLQHTTFILMALLWALFTSADIYYSRDALTVLALSLIKPRRALAYEAHRLMSGRIGSYIQGAAIRRVGTTIAVTARLRGDLIAAGGDAARVMTAHDGIRRERFANVPDQQAARAALGWPEDAFIVGYVGRLHTMNLDKGVGTLIDALRQVDGVTVALVGGPDDTAEKLRQQWLSLGLDECRFLNAGQVSAEQVPLYLSALDVCAMPFPWTQHFAYYASPMKLFEYMASGRVIVASDLPSTAEVVTDGESALLYPPGDVEALAKAVTRLRDDPALRGRLAECAYQEVMSHYTWDARAQVILKKIISHE